MVIEPGTLLKGRYRVGRLLGEGGMAVVFQGRDLERNREVAIKAIRPQFATDALARERFAREARAATALAHPNIIDVFDVGEENGALFLVMELVNGTSLKSIIASEAPFHPDDVAELLVQIGAALDYAHHRGYIHRDIKPGNILIDRVGRAKVVDFGIAKSLADSDLTETGGAYGSIAYIAPEQAQGLMATPASDVYATGVVAFEMLTGRLPFSSDSPVGLAMRHVSEPAPPPSGLKPGVPASVDAIVLRALQKDPTKRWASAGAFASALWSWRAAEPPPLNQVDHPVATQQSTSGALPTVIVVAIVAVSLATLLWLGLNASPRSPSDLTPTAIVPSDSIIMSGVEAHPDVRDEDQPVDVVSVAADLDAEPPSSLVRQPPTIAPAGQAVVVVPSLQGLTISGTTSALLPLGLRVAQAQPSYSTSIPLNAVVSQDPAAGSPVAPGTTVYVSLSRGPSPFGPDDD